MDFTALLVLLSAAATIAIGHTAAGPDHYVPFIAMSRAGRWSFARTLAVTTLCGLGHVLSSVLLGVIVIIIGQQILSRVEWLQEQRGNVAGWLLLGFGLAYLAWGIVAAIRNRPHSHLHVHADGTVHAHAHTHTGEHLHVHEHAGEPRTAHRHAHEPALAAGGQAGMPRLTPWILFTIFVFGPCEPMIPLLLGAAAKFNMLGVLLMSTVYAVLTIATMLAMVTVAHFGLRKVASAHLERYMHASAGAAVAACGFAMVFLDL